MFLAKDGGLTFKPLEWAVGASGMSRHVQPVGKGVWGVGDGLWVQRRRGRERRERKRRGKGRGKGKAPIFERLQSCWRSQRAS